MIFTRNPVPGKCKTRLAAEIGDTAALAIYTFLLKHTASVTAGVSRTDKFVYYSDHLGDGSLWDPEIFRPRLQQGDDLGERMRRAFEAAFKSGYSRVIIIGSDLYDLSTRDLEDAFENLRKHAAVIGPATDGGYYLLGLTRPMPRLFKDKAWGTDSVLAATLKDLGRIDPGILPARNDIDYYEDIAGHPDFEPFLNLNKPNDEQATG